VRLVCTTNANLNAAMERGEMRSDFFYFINVMPIETPPLGRRREDLPLLVSHFLEQATDDGNQKLYTPKAIEQLATKDWPKEVSHLFDLVKQGVAINQEAEKIKADAVPSYEEARDQFTRDYLVNHMQRTNGNITEAARLAKRNRTDFYKLLARFRLNAGDFKPPDPRMADARRGDRGRRASDFK
jgi:two-component system, NtrC family, response regulator GlrR